MPEPPPYAPIVRHYEACLARHGDSHRGVDWPSAGDAETRYRVMLEVMREPVGTPISLLDFGCGAGHLLEYIRRRGLSRSEEHTSELQSLMRISYAVFCLKKKN